MNENKLKLHVIAVNRANKEANRLQVMLRSILEPFVGKNVVKKSGGLVEKLKRLIPEFEWRNDLRVTGAFSEYTLGWDVYANEADGVDQVSYKVWVCVGTLNKTMLTEFRLWSPLREDYTFEEVKANYEAASRLKKEWRKAVEACSPFFDERSIY